MTREDIIRMAREAGFKASVGKTAKDGKYHPNVNALSRDVPVEWLERFAALVAADEHEACETACDQVYHQHIGPQFGEVRFGIAACKAAIRARGQA